jgi:Icc-related predicted phosphoesterase
MIFLYATDTHGAEQKFNDILSFAIEQKINLIHLGSDFLPKGFDFLSVQKKFINGFLKDFYKKCEDNKIKTLVSFGNDDIYTLKKYFRKFGSLLDEEPQEIEGYYFSAYSYTCDYPFALKTACKLDYRGWKRPYVDYGVDFDKNGEFKIKNLDEYFNNKSTIEEDLKKFKVSEKSIVSCHMPPNGLSLDVCSDGSRVGSKSVREWIEKNQNSICLVLCGHIHESYNVSTIWKTNIGQTLVVQPGQLSRTRFVVFDIENQSIKTRLVEV